MSSCLKFICAKGIGLEQRNGVKTTKKSPVHIIADDREQRCGIVEMLEADESVSVSISRLACGDYEVDDHLLFERKTLTDLTASIKDGRIFRQGYRLAQSHKRGIIILEGTSRDLASSNMRREALQGALVSLTVFLGIPLLRSRNVQETAQLMLYTARQNRAIANGGLHRHGVRPRGKRKTQLHILQGIPGVGPERANTLLDQFGSVEAVFTASMEELLAIKGIGKNSADAIVWAVREADSAYDRAGEDADPVL